jgi:hypothetical protein
VEEAAVPSARPLAARGRLEEDDPRRRLALADRERRPEPGVAAADDRDVGVGVALERRRRLDRRRLVEPPGTARLRYGARRGWRWSLVRP